MRFGIVLYGLFEGARGGDSMVTFEYYATNFGIFYSQLSKRFLRCMTWHDRDSNGGCKVL